MAQPNDAGLGGGKLDAAQVAKMDALRAAMQAKAAQYAAPTRPQPAKPATSSTAYNPLSSANTGLPAARKVGTTLAPTAEEALRQRQAAPAPVAPARPVIPTVAPRPSGTTSAAYNPLSSANTGRPAPQPLPTRGYNYTESDTASGQPAYMRRQEIDRAQMAAQAAALANAQRQQAQQAQQAQPGHVRAQELPPMTDPPAGWWTPAVDWSNPTNAVRLTGRPPERPTFPAQPPQLSNLLPYGPETLWMNPALVPGISPGVRQYIADRDLARTTPGGDAWVNYSQQAEAERARAAEAERFAAMGLPTTYMPYSEEELRAMASRPDRFNPIFAAGSHLADQVGYGFEKEVSTEPIPFTERTDEQGNPIPNTYVSIGGGLNIFVNALTKAYEIGTAGRNLVFQSQMGNETRARAAEEQIDELVAAAVPALTANVEALRDVNAAIADAAKDAAGPALGPQPQPATPPPTLYDWLGEAKRNFGIVPVGPKTLDQALLVAARDPDYMSPMTINGINTAITDINRQMILDAQAAQRMANVRPMTYGEWSAEAPTFYDALERLGIVNGKGVPYPEMATVIASSGAENQNRVLENFEMKAKLPLIRELRNQMLWAGTESGTALALSLNSLIMRLETSTYSELVDLETNLPMELLDNFLLDPLNMFDFPLGKVAEAHLLNKTLNAVGGLRTLDNADDLANLSKVFRDVYKPWLEGGRVGEIVLPANLPADLAKLLPTADELRGPQNFLSRMIARTPETRAHLATNNIWMAMANVLHGVDNADDAILILRTISDNPEQMIQGVAGLTSPAFVKIADENGLVRWGPGVMSNPTFVREMPIFQAGAAEVIARLEKARDEAMKAAKKAKTLYDGSQHRINPLELMADLHREWDRAARQLLGITPITPPTGATKLALHDLADGTAQVEWLDDANKVVKQFPAQPLTKAQEQLAVLQAATQKAKENPLRKGLRTSANIQRSFMSDMWLNMPPRHWNRNAAAATLATSVDGLYSFKTTDEALGTLGKKFVEGRATERLTESVSGAGALGNVSNQNWTRGFWPKHNPYAWMMERGAEMWTGTKQIAGRIPYGEQSFYIKAYDRGFSRLFDADWKTLTRRELEPLIRSWNVDPVVGKAILDKIIETGQMGSKADVAQVARQITHGAAEPFSLRNLGIANEVIPPENGRRILEAVNTLGRTVPGQPAETVEAAIQRVANLIRAQFDQMRNRPGAMLWEAMPAPTPVEHLADEAINTVTLVDDALRDAREAGITDPAQLAIFEQEAQEYARRLVEGETTGWEGVLDELANAPDNPAGMAASFDLLSQVYELKRMARQEVDELMAPVRAAHTKAEKDAAWLAKFAGTADIYTKLADDLQATFAGSMDTLRRIAAGEDVPQQRDWWDVITRYLDFDARDNLLTRSQDFGDMMQEDPAIVQKFIDANRAYVDSSYIQLYDIFRRYPSLDSLDMLRMAQKQIDAEGARAAAFLKTQRNRIKHFDEAAKQMVGDLTKAEYYVIRNDTWRELFDNQVIFNQAAARAIAGHALAMESPTKLIWTDDFIGGTFQLIGPAADDQMNAALRLTVDDLFERGAFDAATGKIADKYLAPKPLPRVVKGKSKPKWAMTPEETETYLKALAVAGVTEWRDDGWYLLVRDADAAQQMVQERGKFAWLARNVETGEIEIFGSPNPMAPIAPGTGGTARVPGAVMQDFEALVRGEPFPTRPAAPNVPPAAAATPPTPPVAPAAPPAATPATGTPPPPSAFELRRQIAQGGYSPRPAPTKITKEMRKQLYDLRYRKADVAAMTPADAQRIIDSGVTRTGEVRKGAWKEAAMAETPPSPAQPRQAAQAENAVSEATAPAAAAQPPAAPAGEAVSEAAPDAEAPAGYRNAFTPEQAARHGLPPEAATGAPSLEPTTPRDAAPASVPTVPQEVLDAKATQSDSALWEQAIDAEIGKATPVEPRPVDDVIPDGVAPQEWTDAKASVDAERQAIAAEADIAQPFVLRLDDVEEMAGGEALPAAQVGPKELWQMTPQEWLEMNRQPGRKVGVKPDNMYSVGAGILESGMTIFGIPVREVPGWERLLQQYEDAVRDAVAAGKAVPPEAIARFPDLAARVPAAPIPAPVARPPVTAGLLNQLAAGAGIATAKADGTPTHRHLINAINKDARLNNAGWSIPQGMKFTDWVTDNPDRAEQAAEWLATRVENAAKLQPAAPKAPKPKKAKAAKAAAPAPAPSPAFLPDLAQDVDFRAPLPPAIQKRMGAEGNGYMDWRRGGVSGGGFPVQPQIETGVPGRPYSPPANGNGVPAPALPPGGSGGGYPRQAPIETGVPGRPYTPAAVPVGEALRYPYEMTFDEFKRDAKFVHEKGKRQLYVQHNHTMYEVKAQRSGKLTAPPDEILRDIHRNTISAHINSYRSGQLPAPYSTPIERRLKPVADNVLADYPDLAKRQADIAAQAAPPAPTIATAAPENVVTPAEQAAAGVQSWEDVALAKLDTEPIAALRGPGTDRHDTELELAYREAEAQAGGPPTLQQVHTQVIQTGLQMAPDEPITRYSNMRTLQTKLQSAGFVFDQGKISPPPTIAERAATAPTPPNPARASFMAGADLTTRQRAQDLLDAKPRPRIDTQTRREMVEAEHAQGLTAEQRGGLWYIGDRQVTTTEADYLRHLQATPAAPAPAPYTEPVASTATAAPAVPGHRYLGVNRYDEPIYERVTDGERMVVRNGIGMSEDADGGNHYRFITQEEAATPAAPTPPAAAAAMPAPGAAEAAPTTPAPRIGGEIAEQAGQGGAALEPWQMTWREFENNPPSTLRLTTTKQELTLQRNRFGAFYGEASERASTRMPLPNAHRTSIMDAQRSGQSIPANVLADYPDLIPAQPTDVRPLIQSLEADRQAGAISPADYAAEQDAIGGEIVAQREAEQAAEAAPAPAEAETAVRTWETSDKGKIVLDMSREEFNALPENVREDLRRYYNWSSRDKVRISKANSKDWKARQIAQAAGFSEPTEPVGPAITNIVRGEVPEVGDVPGLAPGQWHRASVDDISASTAENAFYGTSMDPVGRGKRARQGYVEHMDAVAAWLARYATTPEKERLLRWELERYRLGYLERTRDYLNKHSRVVSAYIAGPSNFPAARMAKRGDSADNAARALLEWSEQQQTRIMRELRPELTPIMSYDADAVERLEAKIAAAEAHQQRMKQVNAIVRNTKLSNEEKLAQIDAIPEITASIAEVHGSGASTAKLLQGDYMGRLGFADYALTNNNANIRRMKERLADIKIERGLAEAPQPVAPVDLLAQEWGPDQSPITQDQAKQLLGHLRGHGPDILGGDNKTEARRDILEMLTGTRPPKSRARLKDVSDAVWRTVGIDPEDAGHLGQSGYIDASDMLNERLRMIVEGQPPAPAVPTPPAPAVPAPTPNTITVKAPVIDTPVQQVGLGELEGLPLATGEPIIPEAGTAGIPRNRDEFVRMATQFDDEIEELDTQRYIYGQLDATEYNRRLDDIEQRRADLFVALGLDAKDDPVQAAARAFPDWDKMLSPFGEQVKPLFREAMGLGEWSPRTVVDEAFPESAIVDAKAWKRQDIDFDLIDALTEYRINPEDATRADRIGDLLFRAVLDDVITPESAKAFWPGLTKDVDEIIARRAVEQADDAAYAAAKAAEAAQVATTPAQPAMRQAWQMTPYEYATQWSDKMADLRARKPRPLDKLYGKRGPTPEQAAAHKAEMAAWNKEYNAASKAHDAFLADQGAHRRIVEQALAEGQPVPANVLAEYPDLATGAPAAAQPATAAPFRLQVGEPITAKNGTRSSGTYKARSEDGRMIQIAYPDGSDEWLAESNVVAAVGTPEYTKWQLSKYQVGDSIEVMNPYRNNEKQIVTIDRIEDGKLHFSWNTGGDYSIAPDERLARKVTAPEFTPSPAPTPAAATPPTPAALPYNDFLAQQRAYIKQRYPSATEDAITTQMADWRVKWREAVEEAAKTQPIPESVIDSYIREFGESAFNSRFRGLTEFIDYELPRVRAETVRAEAIRNGAQFFVARTDDAAEKARITKLTKNLDGVQEFSIDAGRPRTMKRRRYVEEEFLAGTPLTQTEWTGPRGAKNTAWKIGANTVNDQQVEYYRYLEQQRAALLAKQDTNKTYRTPAAAEAAKTPAPAPTLASAALPDAATWQAKAEADLQEFIRSSEARFKQTLPDTPEVAALKQQIIDAEIEFRRRVVQQEEMHAAFERATDRKRAEELRRAWWDYGHGPDGPSAANDVAQTAKVELSSILDGMARQAEGDARVAMSPRDRLLGDMKKAAARTGSDTSHAWSSFDLNAAIKRMEDNPDLPVVELTVETPMTTATRTKPAVPNVGADKFNKAETDAMRAQLEYAAGILERNEASVVVIKYGRSQLAFATPEQARNFAKGVGSAPSAVIPGYSNLSVRGGGFAGMIGNTEAGAFEVWENVIPMQGRAMAPQVDILDNVAAKYPLGKIRGGTTAKADEMLVVKLADGRTVYTDGNAMFLQKPQDWGKTAKSTVRADLQPAVQRHVSEGQYTLDFEPLGLVRVKGDAGDSLPGIAFGTDDGKIKVMDARFYGEVMRQADGEPVVWRTTEKKSGALAAFVDDRLIATIAPLRMDTPNASVQSMTKYFYPSTTPNVTMYGGLGAVDPRPAINDIYQTMIKYWRKPKQPEIGDMALHQVTTLNDAEDRILEALPRLAQPRRNNMTSAQANAFIDAIDRRLLPAFDDAVSRAGYGAQKMADAAMLNYRDRRGLDANLALFIPYHYFYTRGGLTWLRRMARKPSTANMYYDIQKAIDTENLQTGVPERLKGTIPIWTFADGGQLRMSNPLNSMMPFNMYVPDPFQTQEGDTDAERAWTALKNMIPGLLPVYDVAAAAAFDMIDPLPNGDSRVARYTNLRNYVPPAGSAADMALAQFGVITPANLGGDPFDPYRIKRQASFDAQEGAISDEIARYVIQLTINLEGNDPDPWAHVPADKVAEVRAAYIDAAKQAGRDKMLMGGGAGYVLGANLYNFPAAERQLLSAQDLWRYAGYGEQNPMGSAAQRQAVMQMYPALGAYMARGTQPGSLYQPGQQAQANALYDKLDPLYAQQAAIEDNLINVTGGGVSGTALSNATKPIQQEIDALRAQYPDIPEPSGRPASGSNPQEMARWMLRQAVPQGGPTWPGENATKAEKAAYYDARSAWEKERLATFERNLQTIIAGSDPTQDDITFEMFKLMAGKDAPTLLREYGPGYYDSPTKIAYDTRNDVRTQAETARYDAAEALILREFGPAGLDVYKTYAVTEDADREAYKAAHPELKALNFAAYNPNEYAAAVALFGKDAIMQWANLPPSDGSEAAAKVRAEYYDANPGAYLMNAWMNGRPTPYGETLGPWTTLPAKWGMEYQSDYGKDFAEAMTKFGADIWQIAAGYKRGWTSKEKAAYFDKYPQLSDFFDWWNDLLPDDNKASSSGWKSYSSYYKRSSSYRKRYYSSRRSYGRRSYGGGYGGGWGGGQQQEKPVYIDNVYAREFDRNLWNTFSNEIRKWEPPRTDATMAERWRPARYWSG